MKSRILPPSTSPRQIAAVVVNKRTAIVIETRTAYKTQRASIGAIFTIRHEQVSMRITSPLPLRNGVAASYIWIPETCCGDLLVFLAQRFPDVSEAIWLRRFAQAEVVDGQGKELMPHSQIRHGMCVFYYRELEAETPIPFTESILFRDEHLLVVDKPHFLPVIPSGRFLQETLLVRLKNKLALEELTPIHRLDRETAGVMLFSLQRSTRGAYQALFQQRQVQKTYHALAPTLPLQTFPLVHRSCMVDGEQFFVMKEIQGEPNSETWIDCIAHRGAISLYELRPVTGRKHQLRVHLASLGAPITNDSFYPVALPCKGDDFSAPLQLLAKAISFTDPITQQIRCFQSNFSL